jgi:hypothetical protein
MRWKIPTIIELAVTADTGCLLTFDPQRIALASCYVP